MILGNPGQTVLEQLSKWRYSSAVPDWTAYACETAAAFTKAFLLTRPIEPFAKP